MKKSEVLTSNNFAKSSDLVYSEIITNNDFENLKLDDISIIDKNERFTFYKKNKFSLTENTIIFSNSLMIESLFNDLRNINFKNLKLITSQTDRMINKQLFEKMPNCISKWYSVNVNYENEKLIPIPLGLANNYSPKNLLSKDFEGTNFETMKIDKIYVNFNKYTNLKERHNLYDLFENFNWTTIDRKILDFNEYQENLKNHKFVLCPWGNGIDTHRIWEALYSGSIPVIKDHITFKCLESLPVIFIDDYINLNYDYLIHKSNELKPISINDEFLNLNYWINKVRNNEYVDESQMINVNCDDLFFTNLVRRNKLVSRKNRYKSKLIFRIYQLFGLIKKLKKLIIIK